MRNGSGSDGTPIHTHCAAYRLPADALLQLLQPALDGVALVLVRLLLRVEPQELVLAHQWGRVRGVSSVSCLRIPPSPTHPSLPSLPHLAGALLARRLLQLALRLRERPLLGDADGVEAAQVGREREHGSWLAWLLGLVGG